ncbi:MAG: endolytic transglycosylase MltG [Thermodesulfobacteriota bacterium]
MKRAISYILMLLIVLGLLVALSIFLYLATPASYTKIYKVVYIHPGATFTEAAELLKQEGIIKDIRGFSLLVRFHQAAKRIKPGEYSLNTAMVPLEILDILVKGKVVEHFVTIPEGYNIYQVADLLDSLELANSESFLEKCFDPSFISSLGIEGDSLEGYLFPDTYSMPRYIGESNILKMMVSRFKRVYTSRYDGRAKQLGFTMKKVVTLASIIEKETGKPSERPLISAVFHNRLKKGIKLQSDPTVIYGIANFDGNITKRHLKRRSPYNTYLHYKLPPGPIANPGEDSIRAALFPAKVGYLYFVSKNDGTHCFSSSLREHNVAVWKYQSGKDNVEETGSDQ